MNPHRSAIDHILALVGDSPLADVLVLRGSMTMLAWAGPHAREPGDLDWVTRPVEVQPQDRWWPYPYVDGLHRVRSAPEWVHRRPRDELWGEQEDGAEGFRPKLPPDGLNWVRADDVDYGRPHTDLLELIGKHPLTPDGVKLAPVEAEFDAAFGYDYDAGYDGRGVRVRVPFDGGSVQLDFAYDETLPEPPVCTAIPRADGALTALWTAGPALSLAWKLQWLVADQAAQGIGGGKDLCDAVLLAEMPGLRLSPKLWELAGDCTGVRGWRVSDHASLTGGVDGWLERLAVALAGRLRRGAADDKRG